ncbi:helicase-exonuclease AddAB subunit AddA [Metasolibacillus meyeri]|uniref:helicase-exonuclease AddAB subunit AddA n=1 Tax=Metasolibacillus meyeri TaxID=1071052 RepID=UPI000D319B3D|nr:helicase-exonuclease AddAB subunit AddA [Metasolibacillus meyeri]
MTLKIPKKPTDAQWTDEQWKAIWATGQDTLVSAAAGSGKTAVLIERLIQKIIAKDEPLDVDELLVVTFTNASAAEMRSRLAAALEKEIAKDSNNRFLRRQLSLINKAQISTLHSFCLAICRQYAYMIDLDPGFRIASQDEVALLQDDVLSTILEQAYGDDGELLQAEVYELVDSFSSDRHDQEIEVLLLQLYNMSRVQPAPYEWLDTLAKEYDIAPDVTVDDLKFTPQLKTSILNSLYAAENNLLTMQRYAEGDFGIGAYSPLAVEELAFVQVAIDLLKNSTWQDVHEHMQKAQWGRLPTIKKSDDADSQIKEMAKNHRDEAKDIVKAIKDTFFIRKPQFLLDEIRQMKPIIETLVKLVKIFSEAFKAAKLERAFVDFSDLEHYALEILTERTATGIEPSAVARDFQERFKEVLVDEYQDVNLLQETILQLVKSGDEATGNLFMVGDVKQSIYQFRLAEPRLFLRKYKDFSENPIDTGLKIDLNANFRSRSEVLAGTNYVFERIMDETVGEINYDEQAALKFRAQYSEMNIPVEFVVLDQFTEQEEETTELDEEQEELRTSQQEARYMIRKIQHMIEKEMPIYNPKDGTTRPIRYSDIVILMRSMTWSADFAEEFKVAGIPLYAESSKGYFDALEVMIMLNVLKIVDNPYQDIPLASVLRAPFFGLTENELAEVRLAKGNVPFFEAVTTFIEQPVNSKVAEKLDYFLTLLDKWRHLARRGSLADLIWTIYLDTNYYEFVGAMTNGKQRQANLRALHDRALAYEKTSFRGLFRFLRFVDRMKSRGDDLGIAKSIGEGDDVVRLMTIHSSKGLEFPVVFVAGIAKSFNQQDFKGSYLFDQDFGLAVKAINTEERTMFTSLPYLAIKEKKIAKLKAEEMRILYVAMTRAKERLILLGTVKNWEKKLAKWEMLQDLPPKALLPNYLRASANSFLDWVAPALVSHPDFLTRAMQDEAFGEREIIAQKDSLWSVKILATELLKHIEEQASFVQMLLEEEVSEQLVGELTERFTAIYPYLQATTKKSKTSVSEIKRFEALQQEEDIVYNPQVMKQASIAKRPSFIQSKALSAAEMGTVIHSIMQHVPQQGFTTLDEANGFVGNLVERELLTKDEAAIVKMDKVMEFFNSPIGVRFKQATQLLREVPFTISRTDSEGDSQIVQGVIDCLFEENGQWVLLDYKTDKIRPPFEVEPALTEEMAKRYQMQLQIYSEAIEMINQVQVTEKILYLYDIGQTVVLK